MGLSVFDDLELPEGLDKETLTNNILLEGGEFEVLYADPNFIRNMVSVWGKKVEATIDRWVKALAIEYNPLENYDRQEAWTDTLDSDGTMNSTGTNDTSTSGTVTNNVSAYDSSNYQPSGQNISSETVDNDTTNRSTSTLDNESNHRGRVHGNIGVTTSQQMLESELELGYWNIYSRITDLFLNEFCIMIYS